MAQVQNQDIQDREQLLSIIQLLPEVDLEQLYVDLGLELPQVGEGYDIDLLADEVLNANDDFVNNSVLMQTIIAQAFPNNSLGSSSEEIDEVELWGRLADTISEEDGRRVLQALVDQGYIDVDVDTLDATQIYQAIIDSIRDHPEEIESLEDDEDPELQEIARTILDSIPEDDLADISQQLEQVQIQTRPVIQPTPIVQPVQPAVQPVQQRQAQQAQQAFYPRTPSTPIQNNYQLQVTQPTTTQQAIQQQAIQQRIPAVQQPVRPAIQLGTLRLGTVPTVPSQVQQRQPIQQQQTPVQTVQTTPTQGSGQIPTSQQLVDTFKLQELRKFLQTLSKGAKPGSTKVSAADQIVNILVAAPQRVAELPELATIGTTVTPVKRRRNNAQGIATPTTPVTPPIVQQGLVAMSPAYQPIRAPTIQQPQIPQQRPVQPRITPNVQQNVQPIRQQPQQPQQIPTQQQTGQITVEALEKILDAPLRQLYLSVTGAKTAPRTKAERAREIANRYNSGFLDANTIQLVNTAIANAPQTPARRKTPATPATPVQNQQPVQQQTQPVQQQVQESQQVLNLLQTYQNAIGNFPTQDILNVLGMIPPVGVNQEQYIRDNLPVYGPVLRQPRPAAEALTTMALVRDPTNASRILERYTDQEIFAQIGVYVPYRSRTDLLNRIAALTSVPDFFVPLQRNCANEVTTTGLPTGDLTTTIIAYGTLQPGSYQCYDPQELTDVQRVGQGYAESLVINGPDGETFSGPQVQRLEEIARAYSLVDILNALSSA